MLKLYCAFRELKNFACVVMYRNKMVVTLTLNSDRVTLEQGFSRDVQGIGTWGLGYGWVSLDLAQYC